MASGVCITGAGATEETLASLADGVSCSGLADEEKICRHLDPRQIRRLRRLPRLALSLAASAGTKRVGSVFFGTGWGALSETDRFLQRLFETRERYPSPTDFVGSVHNAPAGQIAQFLGARGANLTLTGETDAFEQALLAAELVCTAGDDPVLLLAADEAHDRLSPLFDPAAAGRPADGGGALLLEKNGCGPSISVAFFAGDGLRAGAAADLCRAIGGPDAGIRFGAVLAGVPAAAESAARRQLRQVLDACRLRGPVIDFRRWVGQFAAASAVAAVAAGRWVARGRLPKSLCDGADPELGGRGILLLGLGASITAVEVLPG
jgi:3-oxoacyl-[acyl-carrier-protein] synthase-1/3-oxoacyl-[acyl-carrier-protein] synthase II